MIITGDLNTKLLMALVTVGTVQQIKFRAMVDLTKNTTESDNRDLKIT